MTNNRSRLDGVQENISAVLLVGGLGLRLKAVLPSVPKPLAPMGDAPFLELLVLQLRAHGIRRVVMCTGYLADQVEQEFGDGRKWGMTIQYSKESRPMGTAGALKLAQQYLRSASNFLVMNGDSFLEMDLLQFIRFHQEFGGVVSMAVCKVPDAARYGTVLTDDRNRVVSFKEKTGDHAPGLINGGVYVFNRAVFEEVPAKPGSLETDLFQRLLERGVYASEQDGLFIDIGTPEAYARAQALWPSLRQVAEGESRVRTGRTGDAR